MFRHVSSQGSAPGCYGADMNEQKSIKTAKKNTQSKGSQRCLSEQTTEKNVQFTGSFAPVPIELGTLEIYQGTHQNGHTKSSIGSFCSGWGCKGERNAFAGQENGRDEGVRTKGPCEGMVLYHRQLVSNVSNVSRFSCQG